MIHHKANHSVINEDIKNWSPGTKRHYQTVHENLYFLTNLNYEKDAYTGYHNASLPHARDGVNVPDLLYMSSIVRIKNIFRICIELEQPVSLLHDTEP